MVTPMPMTSKVRMDAWIHSLTICRNSSFNPVLIHIQMYIVLHKRTVSNLVLREYYCGQAPATQELLRNPMSPNVTCPIFPPVWLLALLLPRVQKAKHLTDTLLIGTWYTGVHQRYLGNILNPRLRLWQKWPQTNQAKAHGLTLVGRDIGWYRHDMLQTSNFEIKSCSKYSAFFVSCSSRAIWMCCSCTWHFQNNTPVLRTQTYTCYHLLSSTSLWVSMSHLHCHLVPFS